MSLLKSLQEATGKKSLWDIIKTGGLSIVLDGNWGHSAMQLSGALGRSTHDAALRRCSIRSAAEWYLIGAATAPATSVHYWCIPFMTGRDQTSWQLPCVQQPTALSW
jgi:hypothetical protein